MTALLGISTLVIAAGLLNLVTKQQQCVLIAILFFGFLMALVAMNSKGSVAKKLEAFALIDDQFALLIVLIFLPLNVLNVAVNVNIYEIRKCIGQVLLVTLVGFVLQVTVLGCLLKVIDPNLQNTYKWPAALLFGVLCTPTDPVLMSQLKTGHYSRVLIPILEGESLLTVCLAVSASRLGVNYVSDTFESSIPSLLATLLSTFIIQVLVGISVGLLVGFGIVYVWNRAKGDHLLEATLTVGCVMLLFSGAIKFVWMSGIIAVCVLAIVIQTRAVLKKTTLILWSWLAFLLNVVLMFWIGLLIGAFFLQSNSIVEVVEIFAFYSVTFLIRGFTFVMLKPILAKMGYGMTWQESIVATVAGVKQGVISLPIALAATTISYETRVFFPREIIFYLCGLFILSYLINGSLFNPLVRLLAIEKVTYAKKRNMSRAVEYILNSRERAIDTLKLDRNTADANWLLVSKCTQIKHPYLSAIEVEDDRLGEAAYDKWKQVAKKQQGVHVTSEDYPNLFNEALREASRRILKVKRVLCMRQYDHGYISHDVLRALNSVIDSSSDRKKSQTDIRDVRRYMVPRNVYVFLRDRVFSVVRTYNKDMYYRPTNAFRKRAYNIAMWYHYEFLIFITLSVLLIPTCFEVYTAYSMNLAKKSFIIFSHICLLSFWVDFLIKVSAFGCHMYFKSNIHKFDFLVVCVCSLECSLETVLFWSDSPSPPNYEHNNKLYFMMNIISSTLKFMRWILYFYIIVSQAGVVSSALDSLIDRQLLYGFEIGRAYLTVLEDLEKKLHKVIDDPDVYDIVRTHELKERYQLIQELGLLHKDRPMLAITTKTRIAVLSILREMRFSIDILSEEGLLDVSEYELLIQALEECYMQLHRLGMIQACPPYIVLQGVSWLMGEQEIYNFLIANAVLVSFNYEDYIIQRGDEPDGIYILLSGLVKTSYEPSIEGIKSWHEQGLIPNCDFFIHLDFVEIQKDVVVSGNVIGELGLFTDDIYDYSVSCFTSCQAYYLSSEVMKKALEIKPNNGYNLEMKIWKTIAIRIVILIIPQVLHFENWSKDRLNTHLQRGFVPYIEPLENIPVTDQIEDIFLIQGVTYDAKLGTRFTAPCYIPITTKLLLLSEPYKDSTIHYKTAPVRLFIIPTEGVNEQAVMASLTHRTTTIKRSQVGMRNAVLPDERLIKSLRKKLQERARASEDDGSSTPEEEEVKSAQKAMQHRVSMLPAFEDDVIPAETEEEIEEDEETVVYIRPKKK